MTSYKSFSPTTFSKFWKPWKATGIYLTELHGFHYYEYEYKPKKYSFPPLCMNCKYYIPVYYSPHFPNASCERFQTIIPCVKARMNDELCGFEAKHYEYTENDFNKT